MVLILKSYLLHNFKKTTRLPLSQDNRQMIICLKGKVLNNYYNVNNKGIAQRVRLSEKNQAFFIDNFYWHELICYKGTIVLVIAEKNYNPKDYFTINDK